MRIYKTMVAVCAALALSVPLAACGASGTQTASSTPATSGSSSSTAAPASTDSTAPSSAATGGSPGTPSSSATAGASSTGSATAGSTASSAGTASATTGTIDEAAEFGVTGLTVTKDPAAAALLPAAYQKGLRFITAAPRAPWEYYTKSNQLVGLDIFVGKAIAAKLGVPYSVTSMTFDGLIPAIQAGKGDVISSAMSDTAQREQALNFIDFNASGNAIIVKAGNPENIHSLLDLCGKVVVRSSGDVLGPLLEGQQSNCTKAGKQPIELKTLPSLAEGLLDIQSGGSVAQLQSISGAQAATSGTKAGAGFELIMPPASENLPYGWFPHHNGFGVAKSETGLAKAMQAALQSLIDDGTMKKIYATAGQESYLLPQALINSPNA
jgi:polar amino acid transport system substrate-binding protein